MKDKLGNELTTGEFFSRWKQGIQQITPYQQSAINLMGTVLVLIGVLMGLYATFITKVWWLFIILTGSLFLTSMALLSGCQKYYALKRINQQIKEEEKNEQESTGA